MLFWQAVGMLAGGHDGTHAVDMDLSQFVILFRAIYQEGKLATAGGPAQAIIQFAFPVCQVHPRPLRQRGRLR